MWLNKMAIFIAICLSVCAGVISVYGLAAIFSGAFYQVLAVAAILETSKVITATWLHRYWKVIGNSIKVYLSIAVVVLMAITSLGIYGFFSRAHIEQQVNFAMGEISQLPVLEQKISTEKTRLADIEKQLSFIDNSLSAMLTAKKTKDARQALVEADKQKKTRTELTSRKNEILEELTRLETSKIKIETVAKQHEVEVGPLKYLANLYYGDASQVQLENAVRILILTIVFVFDPLAISLLIATGVKSQIQPEEKYTAVKVYRKKTPTDDSIIKASAKERKKSTTQQAETDALDLTKLKLE